jgi:hypothetical protein
MDRNLRESHEQAGYLLISDQLEDLPSSILPGGQISLRRLRDAWRRPPGKSRMNKMLTGRR